MRVSGNGRYLLGDDGEPFFYLCDTAWAIFYQTIGDAAHYLENRAAKGFTVVQAPLIFPRRGKAGELAPNPNGDPPLAGMDPDRPNPAFFEHVDRIVEKAAELGLRVAVLPCWANFLIDGGRGAESIIFDEEKAVRYGRYVAERLMATPMIWLMGGDRNPRTERDYANVRAMARGFREADAGRHVMSYHPCPGPSPSSSAFFHDDEWLDFNMMQTGTRIWNGYDYVLADYNRKPVKPVVDGETRYEHSHQDFGKKTGPRMLPRHVRQAAYNAMLSGAMGHTYGCRDAWSFHDPAAGNPENRDVDTHWKDAIDFPAAFHMGHLKRLFTDYPWHRLVPDQEHAVVTSLRITYEWLGSDYGQVSGSALHAETHTPAAWSEDGRFLLVYFPVRETATVSAAKLDSKRVKASWYDPRSGTHAPIEEYDASERRDFTPPRADDDPDFVLVLEAV